ncbi:MAG: hypothetical protein JWO46_1643, partial [Nocardioidaceae bacterium]|nr:hypothetical protein [Nocardioidaceae bacterium]
MHGVEPAPGEMGAEVLAERHGHGAAPGL